MFGNSKVASIGGLILFGTAGSSISKIVYELQSVGLDGQLAYFHKPWGMTAVMFMGMALCLPLAYWEQYTEEKQESAQPKTPFLQAQPKHNSDPKDIAMLLIPTAFDLGSTVLMNVGLLYVTASVYQMLKGSAMLFAALFSVTFLKRKLSRNHVLGLACCVVGMCLVGTASLMSGEGSVTQAISRDQMLLGMGLILASQAVAAAQHTAEDMMLSTMNMAPVKVVGYEGLFGLILTLGFMAPINYVLPGVEGEGLHENVFDTVEMVVNNPTLQLILLGDMAALAAFNSASMCILSQSGAVFRTVLETTRTLFVWLASLALFYGGFGLGESWTEWSWLQLVGFAVSMCGTLVYSSGGEDPKAVRSQDFGDLAPVKVEVEMSARKSRGLATGPRTAPEPRGLRTGSSPMPATILGRSLYKAGRSARQIYRSSAARVTACGACVSRSSGLLRMA